MTSVPPFYWSSTLQRPGLSIHFCKIGIFWCSWLAYTQKATRFFGTNQQVYQSVSLLPWSLKIINLNKSWLISTIWQMHSDTFIVNFDKWTWCMMIWEQSWTFHSLSQVPVIAVNQPLAASNYSLLKSSTRTVSFQIYQPGVRFMTMWMFDFKTGIRFRPSSDYLFLPRPADYPLLFIHR